MSRMKQLQALAKEAREKGDRDKYEMIRGDIFKEFDFDIGKFGIGGAIKKAATKSIMRTVGKLTNREKKNKDKKKKTILPKYLKGKKFDDPDFYDLIDKNETMKKEKGGEINMTKAHKWISILKDLTKLINK